MSAAISLEDVHAAVGILREKAESQRSEDKEAVVKINAFLDEQETVNQKLTAELVEIKKGESQVLELKKDLDEKGVEAGEQRTRIDLLEKHLARSGDPEQKNYKDGAEFKAFNKWCRDGDESGEEFKALLRTDSAVDGGYLVTGEMDTSITKKIIEIDGMRQVARVRTIGSKSLEIPIRNTIPVATFEGEAEEGADSVSTYSNKVITPFRQTFTAPVTRDQLMDAEFDMESEILGDAGIAFAFGEGQGFITGSGHKDPEGLLTNTELTTLSSAATNDVGYKASGIAGSFSAENVITLCGELKSGYNPVYMLNRRELAFIRTFRTNDGAFLWQPGLNGPTANTLAGYNYVISNSMQDHAAGNFPLAFGDFAMGYTIVDRTGLSVVRDEFTLKKRAIIEFTMNRWVTGLVTLPEAIRLLKCEV